LWVAQSDERATHEGWRYRGMAKRFRFRLETVERLRKQARDEQRRVLAVALRDVSAAEARVDELTEQLRRSVELTRGERLVETLDVAALAGNQFHRNWLHQSILATGDDVAKGKERVDQERAKLAEATARLKVLEKLRERRWARHLQSVAREEQAVSDEIAGQGYLRRSPAHD